MKQALIFWFSTALIAVSVCLALPALAAADSSETVAVVLCVSDAAGQRSADLLLKSLRRFGGTYASVPVLIAVDPQGSVDRTRLQGANVRLFDLEVDDVVRRYPFARKVYASAQAEALVPKTVTGLIWLDNETLVLAPPAALDLPEGVDATVRPVYLVNRVALPADGPPDAFWGRIFESVGVAVDRLPVVESFVEEKKIRFYINCQVMAVRPALGIFGEWRRRFDALLRDEAYQRTACGDDMHRIFLHQAVLSAVLGARVPETRIRPLPNAYGYPLPQHNKLAEGKKLKSLDEAVCLNIEFGGRAEWLDLLPVRDALKAWVLQAWSDVAALAPGLYREEGACNAYLVRTPDGDVLIDPAGAAPEGWLARIHRGHPLRALLLTHGHDDHREGVSAWAGGAEVPVIAQRGFADFVRHNARLAPFNARRVAMQRGQALPEKLPEPVEPKIEANTLFVDTHTLTVGGVRFEMQHTGGETPDHALIFMPSLKAVAIGDNYYESFPNIYTLRGTMPRSALGYIAALDKAIALEPELLLPGHGEPVAGVERVKAMLTRYRDAIRYVHDETVQGINLGKDVFTLMREIRLPESISIPEYYGRVSWSVRGIYEAYVGWFDEDPASMYDQPAASAYPDLVALAGGAEPVAMRALEHAKSGEPLLALRLSAAALQVDPANRKALEARLSALEQLRARSGNWIESNWLTFFLKQTRSKIESLKE